DRLGAGGARRPVAEGQAARREESEGAAAQSVCSLDGRDESSGSLAARRDRRVPGERREAPCGRSARQHGPTRRGRWPRAGDTVQAELLLAIAAAAPSRARPFACLKGFVTAVGEKMHGCGVMI